MACEPSAGNETKARHQENPCRMIAVRMGHEPVKVGRGDSEGCGFRGRDGRIARRGIGIPVVSGNRAAAAAIVVSAALLFGCTSETPSGDGPTPGDRASSSSEQETTAHQEPLRTMADEVGDDVGVQAPPSDEPVPDVAGMGAEAACRALLRGGYSGGVVSVVEAADARPGRVVEQDPKPGYEGFEGQLVRLVVSAPFRDELARGHPCVDRRGDAAGSATPG